MSGSLWLVRLMALMAPLFLLACVVFGLASTGCNSDLGIDDAWFQCATDDDCGEGMECRAGQCADVSELRQRCDAYCDDYLSLCNDSVAGIVHTFEDRDDCLDVCKTYPFNAEEGSTQGNSVQCRVYHVDAAQANQRERCPYASPRGAGVCGQTNEGCLSFCFLLMDTCTGEHRQFDTPQDCLEACRDYQSESLAEMVCRRRHISNAMEGQEVEYSCKNAAAERPVCEAGGQ